MAIPAWSVVEFKMRLQLSHWFQLYCEISKQWFGKLNRKNGIIFYEISEQSKNLLWITFNMQTTDQLYYYASESVIF